MLPSLPWKGPSLRGFLCCLSSYWPHQGSSFAFPTPPHWNAPATFQRSDSPGSDSSKALSLYKTFLYGLESPKLWPYSAS